MAICADGRDGGGGSSGGSEMQTLGLRRLGYRPRLKLLLMAHRSIEAG
jgi:hypothetical protein